MVMVAGVGLSTRAERGLEFYRTPIEATRALIAIEGGRLPQVIWEPACGDGAISHELYASGRNVLSTDIERRRFQNTTHHYLCIGQDFLTADFDLAQGCNAVVTNPPFSLAQEFVDKAFSFPSIHYCALLLRLAFLESQKRHGWFQANPPARVHVSSRRLPMMHRDGWAGKKSTSTLAHAWFIWLRGYDGPPQLRWFDWADYALVSDVAYQTTLAAE
jgi:predicted RNA methylase